MEDSPGLQVRDRLFDSPADFVEGGLELFFPAEEFTVRWFSDRSDHAEAEIAFVADPVVGIDPVQNARTAQRRTVVAATFDGVGDPAQPGPSSRRQLGGSVRWCGACRSTTPGDPPSSSS